MQLLCTRDFFHTHGKGSGVSAFTIINLLAILFKGSLFLEGLRAQTLKSEAWGSNPHSLTQKLGKIFFSVPQSHLWNRDNSNDLKGVLRKLSYYVESA